MRLPRMLGTKAPWWLRRSRAKKGQGLNSATGEYGDMIEMGVNDPVKVTRTALQSAASVATLILITDCTVNEIPKDPDPAAAAAAAAQMGGGMGGMM